MTPGNQAKAEESQPRCTLSDSELIEKSNEWVSRLAKTGKTLQIIYYVDDNLH